MVPGRAEKARIQHKAKRQVIKAAGANGPDSTLFLTSEYCIKFRLSGRIAARYPHAASLPDRTRARSPHRIARARPQMEFGGCRRPGRVRNAAGRRCFDLYVRFDNPPGLHSRVTPLRPNEFPRRSPKLAHWKQS